MTKFIRSSSNKPHRCNDCWSIPDIINEKHHSARWWWIYTCDNCGVRWTKLFNDMTYREWRSWRKLMKDLSK